VTLTATPRWRRLWSSVGRTRLAVIAIAFLAYTPGFWWGAPHATAPDRTNAWGVDDEPPLGPLAQAHDIIAPKKEMNPNLGYPMLHPFMVLGSYTPYVGYLFVSGQLDKPSVGYPHGFADPVRSLAVLTWIAHFLSVVLGVGVVLCAYEIGRVLWDERSGVAAAVGAMLVYPMFYYARNSNVDVPVLFFTAAALVAFAHILRSGLTMRRAIVFGVLAGLAVATKEPAFASFAFAPIALLFLVDPGATGAPWRNPSFWRIALAGAGCALLAYAVGSGMLVDYARWSAHIDFVRTRMSELDAGQITWVRLFPRTWDGHVGLTSLLASLLAASLSWPGLALGIGGVIVVARQTPRQAILALSALGYLAVLFFSARTAQLRYLMPVAFVLAIFAGRLIVVLWETHRRPWRLVAAGGAVAAAGTLLLWATDLTYAMLRDSRYDAGAWIARAARPGDQLEYFGSEHKHPPMPATLRSRQAIPFLGSTVRPDTSDDAAAALAAEWRVRRPRFVTLVPDYTSAPGAPYARSCPPAIFQGLENGSLGYRLAATFQTSTPFAWARRPALDYPVVNPPIRIYERADRVTAPT
jgi:hypothetical protein